MRGQKGWVGGYYIIAKIVKIWVGKGSGEKWVGKGGVLPHPYLPPTGVVIRCVIALRWDGSKFILDKPSRHHICTLETGMGWVEVSGWGGVKVGGKGVPPPSSVL